MKWLVGLLCIFVLTPVVAREPLIVIYDSGNTKPIAPYLLKSVVRDPARSQQNREKIKQGKMLPYSLPITTPSMRPGKVVATPKALQHLQRPLFLVGSDAESKRWLADRHEQLRRIGAVGLLIEANDRKDVDAVLAIADGLQVIPASAESFARRLGLTYYPILLSKEGWEQ